MAKNGGRSNLTFGASTRKVEPRVRMVANGSTTVNALRSGSCASVKVSKDAADKTAYDAPSVSKNELKAKKGKLKNIARDVRASVYIRLHASSGSERASRKGIPRALPKNYLRRGNLITAEVPLSELAKLAADPSVAYIELGDPLKEPAPIVEERHAKRPRAREFPLASVHKYGRDVLIGIIDVQGFDFAHEDFLTKGRTRFLRIWDQGGSAHKPPFAGTRDRFTYGSEITHEMMQAAIADGKSLDAPATQIEPQSQSVLGSHGTHVASIAAGNSGVCRNARIVGVLLSIPKTEVERRKSFYDSTRVAHAIDYILRVAEAEKIAAVSINISLGTNGHAHDASSAISRWIDHAMAIPGRCVTVAAGNAGQEAARYEGDLGYVMGRIHTSGTVSAKNLQQDIEWIVGGDGKVDVSENELEIWYGPQDRFAVQVRPPGGAAWLPKIDPGEFMENRRLEDTKLPDGNGCMVSIYNELYHPANGANYISIYLGPFRNEAGSIGIPSGTWTVRLIGHDVRDGRYHGWIERDDPSPVGFVAGNEQWNFPSFFSERSNVDDSSVSSLACGRFIISVANLDQTADRINKSSSQGPTRDGRYKPDIAAPGTNVVAAKGFSTKDDAWIEMTGTSMASPYVCGVAGLMLAINDSLTSSQIEGIMQRTAQPLPGATYAWKNDSGFGRIDADECLREAKRVHDRKDRTR